MTHLCSLAPFTGYLLRSARAGGQLEQSVHRPRREFLLVRHGEAYCNVHGRLASEACHGLTDRGRWQADRLADRLAAEQNVGYPITALFASTVRRALDTAAPIAGMLGIPTTVRRELRVPDPGPSGEGEPWQTLHRKWPPDPDQPSRPVLPGAERWRDYLGRAHACLATILRDHPGGRVVVIGHSETATALITLLAGISTLRALRVDLDHTGITRLIATPEYPYVRIPFQRWSLAIHNDTSHLETTT